MSARKLETFLDMMPGDVVVLCLPQIESWLFWMDPQGVLYCDMGVGVINTEATHNHWIDGLEQHLTLLAEGIETVEDLRKREGK